MFHLFFKSKGKEKLKKVPNGWGRQNYSTSMRYLKNFRADKSRPNELKRMSFIQRFMVEHVTGYRNRNIEGV